MAEAEQVGEQIVDEGAKVETDSRNTYESFRRLLDEIEDRQLVHQDYKDYSYNPSYTRFEVPFFMRCRENYLKKMDDLERQFQREIANHVVSQPTAYEAARLTRHLCITTLWPPLHSHREIRYTQRHYFQLSKKQRKRLTEIMSSTVI